jgi:hypothetical protein
MMLNGPYPGGIEGSAKSPGTVVGANDDVYTSILPPTKSAA